VTRGKRQETRDKKQETGNNKEKTLQIKDKKHNNRKMQKTIIHINYGTL